MGEKEVPKKRKESRKSSSALQAKIHYPPIISAFSDKKERTPPKRREKKAQEVLFGLLEHYLVHGKPVGSQTLKEAGFAHLSSATIRNYFSYLEKEGLLKQMHSSGGRVPTDSAWRLYVDAHPLMPLSAKTSAKLHSEFQLSELESSENLENPSSQEPLFQALERSCQRLSDSIGHTCFLIPPSFSHDQPRQVKIWPISSSRAICITVTQLGFIRHDSFNLDLSHCKDLERLQRYIEEKMESPFLESAIQLDPLDKELAQTLYNELMIAHLLDLQKEKRSTIFTAGLAKLVEHSDSDSTKDLLTALHFFESARVKEKLLSCSATQGRAGVYIGEETRELFFNSKECSLFVAPLLLGGRCIAAIGALTPKRAAYTEILQSLDFISGSLSAYLTRSYYTHQIPHNVAVNSSVYSSDPVNN